jgi:maltose-binding protein MalE
MAIRVLLTVVLLLATSGCRDGDSSIIGRALGAAQEWRLRREPEQVIHLRWWITYAPDSAEYATFQDLAETYTEHTGVVIDLVSVPWDDIAPRGASSRLALAIQADRRSSTTPDVWGPVPSTWIGPYVRDDLALALEPEQIRDIGQYADAALLASRWSGKQYAVPVFMDSLALIYNRALVPNPPGNYQELIEIAQGLTDTENRRWGLVLPLLSQYHVYPFMDGYGGYILNCQVSVPDGQQCDPGDVGLNNDGSARALEFLSDLYVEQELFPESLADRAEMHDEAVRLFVEGRAGMLIDGSWVLSQANASGIDYGIAPIPELPQGTRPPRSLTTVQVLAASARTAAPTEAADLMLFLSSPKAVIALHNAIGKTPVRRDVLRQPALREDRNLRMWYDLAASGVLLPQEAELGYVWAPWARALDEAIPGLRPAQEALDQAVEQIKGYIEAE